MTFQTGPNAQAIIDRDEKLLSTSYTREYPLVVKEAQGTEVWDVDGNRFVDFMAGIAVHNVGHRHPRVVDAVREQVDRFWHVCLSDFYYPEAVELAEKLHAIAPMTGQTRYYLGNSGTEAVEAAAKLAMYHTGRDKFIGFLGGFHGRTMGSLSFTASKRVQSGRYPKSLSVFHVPYPNTYRPLLHVAEGRDYGQTVVDYIEQELFRVKLDPHDVAGILVEPIQGEGGYVIPPASFFPRLRQLCDQYGIMLILDEVQAGVGRTGKWWGINHEEGIEPDILCFAKGIASGMPLGGIMAKEEVMSWKPGAHGSTYGGNPIAIASANATLDVIREENLLDKANESGQQIMDILAEMKERYRCIGDIRGRGLMIGVEFVKDRTTKERAVELRDEIVEVAFEHGLLTLPCGANTIRLIPPLNTSSDLIDEGMKKFETAVSAVEKKHYKQK